MLSRVADAVYWMCRYIERAENVARFIDVNLHLMLDLPMASERQWKSLITVTGDEKLFFTRYDVAEQYHVTRFLTFDPDYPNSIFSCLRVARDNAQMVRDIISSEMWEQVNKFYLFVKEAAKRQSDMEPDHEFFEQIKLNSHLFTGITEVTMSHGEAWHFSQFGRSIERADKTSRILDVKYFLLNPTISGVKAPFEDIQWSAVLKSASGLEMYRKKYHRLSPKNVAEFLIFDPHFPRAIRYCLHTARSSLFAITGTTSEAYTNLAERYLGRLCSDLDYADIDEVFEIGMHRYLDEFQARLNRVGDAISQTFFGGCKLDLADS
jgi:uncharacterized alpha-E superfamily protein